MWAWGDGTLTPTRIGSDTDWHSVEAGEGFSLAIKYDRSLWGWGNNGYGQLCVGDTTNRAAPTACDQDERWIEVAAGPSGGLAVRADHTLWRWGAWHFVDSYGETQLPVQVGTSSDWAAVTVGGFSTRMFAVAIKQDRSLWSWGANSSGQLGLGDTTDREAPTRIGVDNDWVSVDAGGSHVLALRTDGSLWSWGANFHGQLGLGDRDDRWAPTRVGTANDWLSVSAGGAHSVAVSARPGFWIWGDNAFGQLGVSGGDRQVPVHVAVQRRWKSVSAGSFHTAAVRDDGTLWTFGRNEFGQLGTGDTNPRPKRTMIGTGTDWTYVSAGARSTTAVRADGTLWTSGIVGVVSGTGISSTTFTLADTVRRWLTVSAGGSEPLDPYAFPNSSFLVALDAP